MNVERLLQRLSPEVKKKLKETLSLIHESEQPLLDLCTSVRCLHHMNTFLDAWERKTLEVVVKRFATAFFRIEQLEKAACSSVCGAGLRWGILGLRQKGILFTLKKSWGESIFVLPADTFPVWQQIYMAELETLSLLDEHEAEASNSKSQSFARDLLHVLHLAAWHQPSLKKDGTLPKRWVQKAAAQLSMDSLQLTYVIAKERPDAIKERFATKKERSLGELMPSALTVLLDTASYLRFLDMSGSSMQVDERRLNEWFLQVGARAETELYGIIRERLWPENPYFAQAAVLLERIPQGKWLSMAQLKEWVEGEGVGLDDSLFSLQQESAKSRDKSEWLDDFRHQWLDPMSAFGWMELGAVLETGEEVVRRLVVSPCAEQLIKWEESDIGIDDVYRDGDEKWLYVQPDFEILLLPDSPMSIRWELLCAADIVSEDALSTYRLTKESIQRAVLQGKCVDKLLVLWERYAHYGIPDNVQKCVKQWAHEVSEVRQAVNRNDSSEKSQEPLGEQPLSLNPIPRAYPADDQWPEIDEVYPGLARISAHWLKEMRTYHLSTKKEMIRQAIGWKALLRLRNNGKKDTVFRPVHLREEQEDLAVEGITDDGSVILSLKVWEEMQLILPGINDNNEDIGFLITQS